MAAPGRQVEKSAGQTARKADRPGGQVAATAQNPTPDALIAPPREEVASLAYSYWQARGEQGGSAEEDWFKAEEALRTAR